MHTAIRYCYQCSRCDDNCPVHAVTAAYSPRQLILTSLLGVNIISAENRLAIYGCTVCDTCDEVCPNKIPLTHIFSVLKNIWGEVTAGGCSLMCPNDNMTACTGCFGKSNKPDAAKSAKLKSMLDAKKVGPEDANLAAQFILLYNGLPPQGSLYLVGDPLRKLALGAKMDFSNDVVGSTLKALANNPNMKFTNSNVCGTCDRNGNMNKKMTQIKRFYEGPVYDTEKCFINQGMICMGPMTQAGCGAICPNNGNTVCNGCYGPVFGVGEQGARGISTIASLADVNIDAIKNGILDPVGLFYRYTLAASEINKKVNDTKGGEKKK